MEPQPAPKKVLLAWKIHPFARQPLRGGLALLFLLAFVGWIYVSTGNPFLVVMATLFFLVTLSTFFFPNQYILCENEVIYRCLFTRREPWEKWKRWEKYKTGFLLSPFSFPSRREFHLGIFLKTTEENREAVFKILEKKVITSDS